MVGTPVWPQVTLYYMGSGPLTEMGDLGVGSPNHCNQSAAANSKHLY